MKKAFTLLELVFVIVIIGILSATILPNIRSNQLREAAIQLVSHIRYTQHLAMVDDKYDASNNNWYKERWQLVFNNNARTFNQWAYSIYSDAGAYSGSASASEIAKDPAGNDKILSGGSSQIDKTDSKINKKMNIGRSYGITSVNMTGSCIGGSKITFDHQGRPIAGVIHSPNKTAPYTNIKLISQVCNIILTSNEGNVTIKIEPETGYAHIDI